MAFCTNCGNAIQEGFAFCTNCGTKVKTDPISAPQPENNNYNPNSNPGYNQNFNGSTVYATGSYWDGGVLETFVASIVYSLLISITCGIATPWAVCYFYKYVISHVVIDGKRLYFDGTGGALFGNWLLWSLLTLITCGIYGFWVVPKMYNWFASHTHLQ